MTKEATEKEADKQKSSSSLNLYQKLSEIYDLIGAIQKTGRNKDQGYEYIEQGQILAEVRHQLAAHHVFIKPKIKSRKQETFTTSTGKKAFHTLVDMEYEIIDADKPDDRFTIDWDGGESTSWDDKGTQKALTSNQKYFLAKLFMISDKEDADKHTPEIEVLLEPQASTARQASPQVAPAKQTEDSATNPSGDEAASTEQKKAVFVALQKVGIEQENMNAALLFKYEVTDPEHMTAADAQHVIDKIREQVNA